MGDQMATKKAGLVALLVFGLGLAAILLQTALDQARQASCNYSSTDTSQCLAPAVANYGLSSDGPERKVKLRDDKDAKPAAEPAR
jgi:hypothetical protein